MKELAEVLFARLDRLPTLPGGRPPSVRLFRRVTELAFRLGFPPEGWDWEWVEEGSGCFGFDVRRCFYLETLAAYGAPELTRVHCYTDDIQYQNLPDGMRWARTQTLGRGDDVCDFRWCWEPSPA
jgi:hypothetical protein